MADLLPDSTLKVLRRDLLAWFDRERRDLPWRRKRSLYGTWVAEMMLQQTSVAVVVPYWERFLARWPDVAALAEADEEEVLAMWSGLGYYRRARDLHVGARRIVSESGGHLPADRDSWQEMPGVGPYAAGAIASMALGQAVPAIDSNARRVLLRWCCTDPEAAAGAGSVALAALGSRLVPPERAGDWNEAVMELGALICSPRNPACRSCPVRASCAAHGADMADAVLPATRRAKVLPVVGSALVVHDGRRVFLVPSAAQPRLLAAAGDEPARSDLGRIHRGLWGPPMTPWYHGKAPAVGRWRRWLGAYGLKTTVEPAGEIRHSITRWRLHLEIFAARLTSSELDLLAAADGGRTAAPGNGLPLSSLAAGILARAGFTMG